MKILFIRLSFLIFFLAASSLQSYPQVKLDFMNNRTPTHSEVIEMYEYLAANHSSARLITGGITDSGRPLHLFVISGDRDFDPVSLKKKGKSIILINNAIHAGEPNGVDASLKLADDILNNRDNLSEVLENTVICIIPVYSTGGFLNRSPYNRANQVGPAEQGFRANAANYDLNRDFVKADTRNAFAFMKIFHKWQPDIFIDTHTTNGADYPYVITLIPTQFSKANPHIGSYMREEMSPELYSMMEKTGYEMIPYVQTMRGDPRNGIISFMDAPRYSTGYTSLFNTLSFMVESHMLKPYHERVLSTYHFLVSVAGFANRNHREIKEVREKAAESTRKQEIFTLEWQLDTSRYDIITFRGYETAYRKSNVTGQDVLYYDHDRPYTVEIPYYTYYKPSLEVENPEAYIIPQAWHEVVTRLKGSGVEMSRLMADTTLFVDLYYIEDYSAGSRLISGRYPHSNIKLRKERDSVNYYRGDYVVKTNQAANNYIVQTLEPQGTDSFFRWNFFDPVLNRIEYFSTNFFDSIAEELLENDPELREKFLERRNEDSEFAGNARAQLSFIYENSPYFEKTYRRYPVARFNKTEGLSLEYNYR